MKFKKLHPDAQLPTRQSKDAAGYDLHALVYSIVHPGQVTKIGTGVATAIPENHVGLILDRSGLATKKGIMRLAGVIDADYRGEIVVALTTAIDSTALLQAGDRIAQMVVVPCVMTNSYWVEELDATERGDNGFGSTDDCGRVI